MSPRVACYIPAYNPGPEFGRCLSSIGASTLKPFVLVVDDGSDERIAVDFSAYGLAGEVLHLETNVGHARAANAGLSQLLAMGFDYIARMDADDLVLPARFETQAGFLDANPTIELLATSAETIDEYDAPTGLWKAIPPAALLSTMARNNCVCHPTIMHRASYVRKFGFYPEVRVASDYEFMMRAAIADALHILDAPLTRYRIHGNSISFKKYGDQLRTRFDVQIRYLKHTRMHGVLGLARTLALMVAQATLSSTLLTRLRSYQPTLLRPKPAGAA